METQTNSRRILTGTIAGLLVIGAVYGAYYYGFKQGAGAPKTVVLGLKNAESASTTADFNIFWQTWQILKDDALKGKDLTDQKMIYGAVRGLVNSLNDPYSVYLPPEDSKKFQEDISGSFSGVGMEISKKNGNLVVVAPIKGTPAEKAGLQPNDQIVKIDDTFTDQLDVDQAVKLIRGKEGSTVTLLVYRDGWSQAKEFKIKRAVIDVPTVEFEMKDGNLAYIKLNSFNEKAPDEFYKALKDASSKNAKGVVVDLRNDPGGYLEVAVDIAGWFIEKDKLVVSEQFRDGKRNEFKSNGPADLKDFATVVLVNEGSASASEILAGALRDQRHVKLIGQHTFGKGTVQLLKNLTDGSTVKITVANWVLPDGTIIEKNGLKPDLEVKITDDDVKNKKDPQLDAAVRELRAEIK